jgi:hypothetical protein
MAPAISILGFMTHIEQHRLVLELKDYAHKMKRYDLEEFSMFEKRDKDDEDLDEASRKRLLNLYSLYVPAHRRILP